MEKKQKEHSLTGRITYPVMLKAFKAVKGNRGAAGIDKVSIKMYEANLEDNLIALMKDIKAGQFEPHPLRRVYIPKSKIQVRPLGIPVVRDRICQEVVRSILSPIFEREFHDFSFGFRPERNCHQAIEALLELHGQGYKVVLDADIKGFFDNIPFYVIMQAIASRVADGNILRLIERFLRSGVMENGVFKPTTVGTPQGGVISPLLANAVLNHMDWQLHEKGYHFARYADDFVVVCKSKTQAKEVRIFVEHLLKTDLGLELSQKKTKITTYGKGYDFLGFKLSSRSRRMRPKSLKNFKDKIRDLTVRKHNLDGVVIVKLNQVIRGTANYFATDFSTCRWMFRKLDSWIRMRLRCMKLKRKSRRDNYNSSFAPLNWHKTTDSIT
ncbi:group II intron reverse transcriptase/maturase [Desulfobacterales bacterium HSG17]|nr:group II intron reverse transcriptase/maturase [Desulfobacterales bacterium HSG17]